MNNKDIFKIWAPSNSKWSNWVKPVAFISTDNEYTKYISYTSSCSNITYINSDVANLALIIDLPNFESVKEGISLAKIGFRPIPIYNGTIEQKGSLATLDNLSIQKALFDSCTALNNIHIASDAPPSFLIDSNRTNRFKMSEAIFDNSWDIYPQDLPSAEYFLANGINKIIVVSNSLQKDLNKILFKFQEKGLEIYLTNRYDTPKKIILKNIK